MRRATLWKSSPDVQRLRAILFGCVFATAAHAGAVPCLTNLDCNDFNECTTDTCDNGNCLHAAVAAGAPCGSDVDDACTDPDTCLAGGICYQNNAPDGTFCVRPNGGGSTCRAGLCGAPTVVATPMPEGGHLGSEQRAVYLLELDLSSETAAHVAGRIIDSGGLSKAAVWESADLGGFQLKLLPTPPALASVANGVGASTCTGGTQTFMVVGATADQDDKQFPTTWVCDVTGCDTANPVMSPWVVEPVPIPPSATTGLLMDVEYHPSTGEWTAVGSFVDGNGFRRATVWRRSMAGTWSFSPLPDYGPGTNSQALGIGSSGKDGFCYVGGAEDTDGNMMPAVWMETAPGSGIYSLLPAVQALDGQASGVFVYDPFFQGGNWFLPGQLDLYDGSSRGAAYRATGSIVSNEWDVVVLPPLPGYANSKVVGIGAPEIVNSLLVVIALDGTSYNVDPLTDGVATRWRVVSTPEMFAYERSYNVNDMVIVGSPGSARVVTFFGGTSGATPLFAGTVVEDAAATAGHNAAVVGTPLPHSYGFTEQQTGAIPAVSTWGLAIMLLTIVTAGTAVLVRRERRTTC